MTTATELLDTLTRRGVMLKAEGDKLLFAPSERVNPDLKAELRAHKADLLRLLHPDRTLADAYRRYWNTPESEPMQTFQAAYAEIVRLEAQADPATAWRTLREAATVFHAESGVCPFCRERGELHLPAEQPELELRHGRS
ncbi:MAG: hypothetical protein K8G79_12685 [bacterium]|uniref:TubC N-terminal docking domain-containing protein n=1 Tax=Candidatus Methylomirabilis tolerans TaxID=3123416 RepID=A0AAJ1AMB4_9BACT|nr:hypothetical protein [Candidatus Methylomirabilis sp.]